MASPSTRRPTPQTPPPGTQTLARGLDILRAVAEGAATLKEVVEATSIGRSTAHRLLQLLEQTGYVQRKDGTYLLGPALIEYGFLALSQNPVPVVARPFLEDLAQRHHDTVHLAVRDAGQVLYLDKVSGSRGAVAQSRIGYRMPLTHTGVGKALLLDETPETWARLYRSDHGGDVDQAAVDAFVDRMSDYAGTGTAMDLEENEVAIRCVAAPVRNGSGRIVASVSLTAARPFMPKRRMQALVPVMRDTTKKISARLGYAVDV